MTRESLAQPKSETSGEVSSTEKNTAGRNYNRGHKRERHHKHRDKPPSGKPSLDNINNNDGAGSNQHDNNSGTGLIDYLKQLMSLTNGGQANNGETTNGDTTSGDMTGGDTTGDGTTGDGTTGGDTTNGGTTNGTTDNGATGGGGVEASAGPNGATARAGGNVAGPGTNTAGSDQHSGTASGDQYSAGNDQYSAGSDQYGAGSDQYGASNDQYGGDTGSGGSGIDSQAPVGGPQGDVMTGEINTDGPLPNTGGPLPGASGFPVRAESGAGLSALVAPLGMTLVVAVVAVWRFGSRRSRE